MSRARKSASLSAIAAVAAIALFLACGGSGDGGNGPSQSVSTIVVTAANTDVLASFGDTKSLTAVAKDASGTTVSSPTLTWSSSAPAIATVAGTGATATVTAIGNGTATITASSGAAQGSVGVTVTQRATRVGVAGLSAILAPGATAQLTGEALDARGRAVSGVTGFSFTSSDQSVAVVSASGALTAIAPGTAQITGSATIGGTAVTGSASLNVTFGSASPTSGAVNATDGNQFVPSTITIAPGGSVTWAFASVSHNATFSSGSAPSNIGNSSSTQVSRVFPTAGTYTYDCTLHPGMQGTVVVQNSTAAPGFTAILSGANERPNAVTTAGGGAAAFVVTGNTVAYTVTFSRLTGAPIMAHIHGPGSAAQAVGVLVDFPTAGQTLNNGVLSGSFTAASIRNANISLDSLLVLMRNGNAYVNVHTTQFPAGEVRGQLSVPQD